MIRPSKTLTAATLAIAVWRTGTARAQTATTTTSTTTTSTSTTLQPHPFSPATKQCVDAARQASKQCTGTKDACLAAYQAAYAQCFAGSAGQKCATKCLTNEAKCMTAVPTTKTTCKKTCRTNRHNDVKACRLIAVGDHIWAGGDAGCLTTARLTYQTCSFQCSEARDVCRTNFRFCIADCPHL